MQSGAHKSYFWLARHFQHCEALPWSYIIFTVQHLQILYWQFLVLIKTWSAWSYQKTSSSCHGSVLDQRFVTPHHTTNGHRSIVVNKYGSLKVCLVTQHYIQQTINMIPASKWEPEIRTLMWWCTYVYLGQYRYWASKQYRVCRDCFYLYHISIIEGLHDHFLCINVKYHNTLLEWLLTTVIVQILRNFKYHNTWNRKACSGFLFLELCAESHNAWNVKACSR